MAYSKHTWQAGEPITQERMNAIEDALADAASKSDVTNVLKSTDVINTLVSTETAQPLSANQGRLLNDAISGVRSDVSSISQQSAQGKKAWTQVSGAITMDSSGGVVISLDNRLDTIEANVGSNSNKITIMQGTLERAKGSEVDLQARLDKIETNVNTQDTSIAGINTLYTNAKGNYASIEARFKATETEISNARGGKANLDARLDDDEAKIATNTSDITSLKNNKVNVSDIVNNLTSTDTNKPLSANMGKSLRDMIGGTYSSASGNKVSDAIANAETNAKNYTDSVLGGGYTSTNTVAKAISALDTSTDTRLDAIESEITAARSAATTTYTSLDARFEDIELSAATTNTTVDSRLNAAESALGVLNGEANVSGSVLNTVNTQIAAVVAEAPEAFNTLKEIADWIGENSDDALTMQQHISTNTSDIAAIKSDLDTATTGIKARVTALETSVNDTNSGLAATKATADSALAKANAAATAETVNALSEQVDNISTTVVVPDARYDDNGNPIFIGATETADYLFEKDGKYYYWKYIKTGDTHEWAMISGGGGSGGGNTSGVVLTMEEYNALETHDENTDYYVLDTDGYRHYRWINNTEIEIGVPESKKYNIDIESIESEDGTINYLNIYEFNYDEDNTIDGQTNLEDIVSKRLRRILLPATGGGSGVTNTMKVIQVPSRNIYKAANSNASTYLRFFFTSGEANEPASYTLTIDGTDILNAPINIISGDPANKAYTWPVDEEGVELSVEAAAELGFYSIDITNYCNTIGTHTATVTVALDSNTAITAPATWNINTFNLSLTSNFTNSAIVNTGSTVSFNYIPTGNVEKTAHFKLNGTEINTAVLAARVNTTQTYVIPAQTEPGAYKLEVYLTANNGMVKSASIFRDIIWKNADDSTIILASPYRNNQETLVQYSTIDIPYTIAGGNGNYSISYYVDDFENSINEITLTNNNTGVWNYRADTVGEHTLRIKCEESYIDIRLTVTELQNVDITPVTANLVLDFNPTGITNTSAKRLWSNDNYNLTVSDNFDWYNGGYGSDINGDYFLVKAGTRATFNYYMFSKYVKSGDGGTTTDSSIVYRDGAELKIIFKTDAVRSADAVWFTNMGVTSESASAKEVGIQLNVHNGWLKTDAAGESTKSYLYFPYSEEDKIELDININKETEPNSVYFMSYEDGCPSRAYPYSNIEALYQTNAKPIVIGSDDCDVYIYRMRVYDSSLTTEEVLRNFIADGKDVNESINRYNRNCIYYDAQAEVYTPYEGPDTVLDPVRLAQKLPDVKILMLDTPHFTTSKKDFIPYSTLRCIHAEGGTIYPSRGKEDNWFFGNGYHAGQGTTSDKYGNSGRNVDFLFNCDGIHNPSDKIKPGKGFIEGYQSYVIKGYGTDEEEEREYCTEWKGDSGKISLTSTSIPNNFFNLKVNVASSENVNNALFQKRYNDYLPYLSPAYLRDNRIKNDMEFVPAILFVRENDDEHTTTTMGDYTVVNYTNHTEFNDKEWHKIA